MPISIKIISTQDINISNQIVRGTNRQNQVLEEAFETTRPFHQRLEEFFNSYQINRDKIYYERRSKQYNYNPTIRKTQIINLRILIQSFTAMFLNKAHESHKHEARLSRELKGAIFLDQQSYLPYYTASMAFYYLEKMFREGLLLDDVRTFKPHFLMMFREAIAGDVPSINSTLIDGYCLKILAKLSNYDEAKGVYIKIGAIFRVAKDIWINKRKKSSYGMKDVGEFTELLLRQVRESFHMETAGSGVVAEAMYQGMVLSTFIDRNGKWCGFIKRYPDNIFFHSAQNGRLDFINLRGETVEYSVHKSLKSNREIAVNVKII